MEFIFYESIVLKLKERDDYMNYTVMSEEAIRFLCKCINQVVSLPTDVINNINLSDTQTFSNIHIKNLIDQCLIDANTEAQKLVGALTHLTCEETAVQPTLDNSQVNVIYLYSATGTAPYQQYLKISDTKLIDLGSTSISLSDYLTATQIASTYAKQVDLNTLTDKVNAIKDTIGTETLTTTSQTITEAINEVAGKSQIISLSKAEYNALPIKDPETYYVISDDEDSVVVSNTVNSASANDTIPTSKAVYDTIKNTQSYSLDEQFTGGTWINGKPVYQKTINYGALPSSAGDGEKNHNIENVENIWIVEAYAITPAGNVLYLPFSGGSPGTDFIGCRVNKTKVGFSVGMNRSNFTGYMTIRYTKTTD